jgi:hypothetical protein
VHDSVDLERRSVPTVFVASTEFIDAAEAQSRALGSDPARVFVAHPSRTAPTTRCAPWPTASSTSCWPL